MAAKAGDESAVVCPVGNLFQYMIVFVVIQQILVLFVIRIRSIQIDLTVKRIEAVTDFLDGTNVVGHFKSRHCLAAVQRQAVIDRFEMMLFRFILLAAVKGQKQCIFIIKQKAALFAERGQLADGRNSR